MKLQTFKCRACGETWTRPAQRGRPPEWCDACRPLQAAKPANPLRTHNPRRTRAVATNVTPDVKTPDFPRSDIPAWDDATHHYAFRQLIAMARARVPAMLVGPAGSGKTTAARQIGDLLGLRTYIESCNPHMSAWDVLGFVGPDGNYHRSKARDAVEHGGVLMFDEMDASNPGNLVAINALAAAHAGQTVDFPDGAAVPMHADCVIVAGCNTYGDGASDQYVGREQLDAATLDRFAIVDWNYDLALERRMAGPDMTEWVKHVQAVRRIVDRKKLPLLVSPRATVNGAKLLRDAMLDWDDVERSVLFRGASDDTIAAIRAELPKREVRPPAPIPFPTESEGHRTDASSSAVAVHTEPDLDKIIVNSPYNRGFILDAKDIGGKWNKERKVWEFPLSKADDVNRIVDKYYVEHAS